jgi:rhodanese-related sulfurtransferase
MHSREFKDSVFQQFALIGHAFSAPKRLEIVDVLSQGERDVETVAREARSTVPNTSRHLQVLKQAGLVETRRAGVRVIYRLADMEVVRYWKHLQTLAEKLLPGVRDTVRRYFDARDGMEPISREELQRRAHKGEVIVLDVRPVEEYGAGHIPGAVSLPLSELTNRLSDVPRNHPVVAYCRGPYCVLSVEAVARLRDAGFEAVRLVDGFPEWRDAGLGIESTEGNK